MLATDARHRLFHAGFAAIAATGADRWLAPLARGCGVILTFHHVRPDAPPPGAYAPNRLLSITPAFLDRTLAALRARGFSVVPLSELPRRLGAGGPPFAVLTFDDGYRDNLEHAVPVLRRHGAPWTLYVTHDFATGTGRLWWIELERAIGALDRVRLPEVGLDLPARGAARKSAAFAQAYRALRAGPEEVLRAAILRLCAEAGIDAGGIAAELCLSGPELRDLARDEAVTLAAHTLTHPMLAKHDAATARREIVEGRARLAALLGCVPEHLSYPVGDPGSAGKRDFALAREAGYRTGVTTRPGHLFPGHADHLHALPRVSVNGCFQTDAALDALLSGVPFLAWNRFRRFNVE
ncbi:polysaccharide deacetylase family protein [Methylobacterium platani]|uniref:Chitooligosaccharide deacetylase n=2 Tax=Methylobacterium platani TaxID=427683 RepID=A0A179S8Y7_9HYPH|nr:polysaccharide deacetylase family protein [Methylobacterium platani]KMO20307.1 polysaccharide deacetylase [Methylobacterium platani JCM 14648]OAS24203.1 polysaccharide deacetylase [Methylobacterium platani]